MFPYGKHCLYEDLDNNASTNDRRFFGRTGEVLYLMCCRAQREKSCWRPFERCFQDGPDLGFGRQIAFNRVRMKPSAANGRMPFFPMPSIRASIDLAEDWLAILRLNITGFDVFPHLVNLAGLHLVKYQLTISRQTARLQPIRRLRLRGRRTQEDARAGDFLRRLSGE